VKREPYSSFQFKNLVNFTTVYEEYGAKGMLWKGVKYI
jgi:hypothetical protein